LAWNSEWVEDGYVGSEETSAAQATGVERPGS
jgi:hypothetical protein